VEMQDLLIEYKESLKQVKKLKEKFPQNKAERNPDEDLNYGYLSNMETSLTFIIKWLSTGRQPGIRGVERLDAYRREVLYDPLWFQQERFSQQLIIPDPRRYKIIEDALSVLSEREKEVYRMSRGEGFSFQEIADILCISRGTICVLIHRAEKKLNLYRVTI
jgi:RNA polymerase sigma-70 factor (ECF subfamily)